MLFSSFASVHDAVGQRLQVGHILCIPASAYVSDHKTDRCSDQSDRGGVKSGEQRAGEYSGVPGAEGDNTGPQRNQGSQKACHGCKPCDQRCGGQDITVMSLLFLDRKSVV